ncbi:MAG: glycosyltransferase [Lachnospiraceae bacterium]|nr:glycosyltransferase [Lachnospiraceae bacterium]
MLVSIITVSYNSASTIGRTIKSVLSQTYDEIEYFIIDGNSKDDTVKIARSYEDAFKERGYKYTVISEPDHGIYDAMNKGIKLSNGELIGIVNSDDWYEPNAISEVSRVYKETSFDMFYADLNIYETDADGRIRLKMVKKARQKKIAVSRHWNHPTTFIPARIYKEFNYYRCQSLYDDFDLWLRIRKASKKIVTLNKPLSNYTLGGISNVKTFKSSIDRGKIRYKIYRQNGYSHLYWIECILIEGVKFFLA